MIKLKPVLLIAFVVMADITCRLLPAQTQINPSLQVASDPPKPPRRGTPDGREPAGSRGSCEKNSTLSVPFTPLLPPASDDGFLGVTLKERPTFWFYIPYKMDSVKSGSFVLREREGNVVYPIDFKLPKTPGFVSVSIPDTAKPLEKNKQYIWKFVLYCASQNSDQPPSISHEGLVQRGDMDNVEIQLRTAKLPERIKLYIDNKIWYDASSDLAQIHSLSQVWRNLLTAIGLEELEQEPIAGSVVPIEN
jgi:hypothetical protein